MLSEIKARWAKAQKGPWMWDVNMAIHQVHLTTAHSGRIFILGFRRWGMQSAQPLFQDYKHGIVKPLKRWVKARFAHHPDFDMDIDHPDAQAIASAPSDVAWLVQECERLRQENERLKNCANCRRFFGAYKKQCLETSVKNKCDEWEATP